MMDIEKIAAQVGFYIAYENREVTDKELQAFANAIIEECASVCDKCAEEWAKLDDGSPDYGYAEAIRKLKVGE